MHNNAADCARSPVKSPQLMAPYTCNVSRRKCPTPGQKPPSIIGGFQQGNRKCVNGARTRN